MSDFGATLCLFSSSISLHVVIDHAFHILCSICVDIPHPFYYFSPFFAPDFGPYSAVVNVVPACLLAGHR